MIKNGAKNINMKKVTLLIIATMISAMGYSYIRIAPYIPLFMPRHQNTDSHHNCHPMTIVDFGIVIGICIGITIFFVVLFRKIDKM